MLHIKLILGLVIAVCSLVDLSYESTPIKSCQDGPTPFDVRVKDCSGLPCELHRGTNVSAEWDFAVAQATTKLKPRVRAEVAGVVVNYPFPQEDACTSLASGKCPLNTGDQATYELSMPILKIYPKISLTIEFAFLNDGDQVVVCFKLPAKVVD
ncbi:hypothetical protein QAD02_010559 [Eretmocerus hayati]|uniref:Uncharacterized protein n=1 Tax=Eretmocerus hayati TaxID=131215 RepID=A0ACC2NV69_9HYME|nr:hypothetical protein QAD02_010559 [Eretmocerus hayati]